MNPPPSVSPGPNAVPAPTCVGMDIGGTKCAVAPGSADGRVLQREAFATEAARGPEQALARLFTAIEADGVWDLRAGE